ncbi:unnamed protein product [Brugia timori]|uniref:Uncharacterized protein n=1 Tax=Brugia timori TaxID=42155 RepID=A0A0R3QGV4_9BILA|nr:unnamed protein product [Brugia timori]
MGPAFLPALTPIGAGPPRPLRGPCPAHRRSCIYWRLPRLRAERHGNLPTSSLEWMPLSLATSPRGEERRDTPIHGDVRRLLASRQVVVAKAAMQMRGIKRRRPGCSSTPAV